MPGPLANGPAKASSHHLAPMPDAEENSGDAGDIDWTTISDQLPFGLLILGPAQELRHENSLIREMAGFGIEEKGGIVEWLTALCPDQEHCDRVIDSWQKHVWRNQLTRTFSLRGVNQKLREIEFRSTLHEDGGMTVVLQDVTDRIRAEETQQHGKLKFRILFSQMENGAVVVDRTGRILDANPAFLTLVGAPLSELRQSTVTELLSPEDAEDFARAEKELNSCGDETTAPAIELTATLRSRSAEKQVRVTYCPIGESPGQPSMGVFLFSSRDDGMHERLAQKLRTVARKAQSLLNAVPDLVLLIDPDFSIADFAPPPHPWDELHPQENWRGQSIHAVWPVLGELLKRSSGQILEERKTIHAEVEGTRQDPGAPHPFDFSITATSAGDGQMLVVVRNLLSGRATFSRHSDGAHPSSPPQGTAPLRNEQGQHSFRNQLQLITSLFSLEPQGAAAKDAFLKWQIRLRALATAVPGDFETSLPIGDLLRNMADQVCSLTGGGPGRRTIVIAGPDELKIKASDASLLAILAGEWMRLVLSNRQTGPGPSLYLEFGRDQIGSLVARIRPGENRRFFFTDEDTELEMFEILTAQMRGHLKKTPGSQTEEWELIAPVLAT